MGIPNKIGTDKEGEGEFLIRNLYKQIFAPNSYHVQVIKKPMEISRKVSNEGQINRMEKRSCDIKDR